MTLGASACAARHQAKNSTTLTLRWPVSILAMIEKSSSSRAASSRWVRPAALRAETSSATTALCSGLLFQAGKETLLVKPSSLISRSYAAKIAAPSDKR